MLTLHKGDPPQLHLFLETVTWPAKVDINNTGENLVGEKKKKNHSKHNSEVINHHSHLHHHQSVQAAVEYLLFVCKDHPLPL